MTTPPGPDRTVAAAEVRLDSWKEIAAYLHRSVRTVQRWEEQEGLPTHRHVHGRLGSVYAFRSEIDVWWKARRQVPFQLMSIVESSNDAIIGTTLDGTIASWNPAATRLFGWTAEEARDRPVSFLVPDGEADETAQVRERIVEGERVEHYETERQRRDGQRIHVSVTASPIRDGAGKVVSVSFILRDVTERRLAEQMLREGQARLGLLHAVARRILAELPLAEVVRATVQDLADLFAPCRAVHVALGPDGEPEEVTAAGGQVAPDDALRRQTLSRLSDQLRSPGAVLLADVEADPRLEDIALRLRRSGCHALLLVGVAVDDRLEAVLALASAVPRDWPAQAVETLREIGELLRVASRGARLGEERTRAEDAQRESDGRFRAMAESLPDAIVSADGEGRILYVSPSAERLFGWSEAELLGRPTALLHAASLQQAHEGALAAFLATGETAVAGRTLEVMARHRDGREFPVEVSYAVYQGASGPCFAAVVRDVSRRHRREELLRRKVDVIPAVIDEMPTPVVVADAGGRIVLVNRAAEEASGSSLAALEGQPLGVALRGDADLPPDPAAPGPWPAGRLESIWTSRDGERRHLKWSFTPLLDSHGRVAYVSAVATTVED